MGVVVTAPPTTPVDILFVLKFSYDDFSVLFSTCAMLRVELYIRPREMLCSC